MSRSKKTWLAILVIGVLLIGYGVHRFREFNHDMQAEYGTAQTIGRVTDYVEQHDGRWPTNWDEIELSPGTRELVVVQFDADIDRLLEDPEAIQSTIVPITGEYDVYPHARMQLNQLREKLIELNRSKPNARTKATSK